MDRKKFQLFTRNLLLVGLTGWMLVGHCVSHYSGKAKKFKKSCQWFRGIDAQCERVYPSVQMLLDELETANLLEPHFIVLFVMALTKTNVSLFVIAMSGLNSGRSRRFIA